MTIIGATHLIKYLKAKKRKRKRAKPQKCYQERSEVLGQLGYASYQEYLASKDWESIRLSQMEKFPLCLLCRRPANQVHHMEYSDRVLLGLEPRLLVTLCNECHYGIEFNGEIKNDLKRANRKLRSLASKLDHCRHWLEMVKAVGMDRKRRDGALEDQKGVRLCRCCGKNTPKPNRSECRRCRSKKKRRSVDEMVRKYGASRCVHCGSGFYQTKKKTPAFCPKCRSFNLEGQSVPFAN